MYGCQQWALSPELIALLDMTHMRFVRRTDRRVPNLSTPCYNLISLNHLIKSKHLLGPNAVTPTHPSSVDLNIMSRI